MAWVEVVYVFFGGGIFFENFFWGNCLIEFLYYDFSVKFVIRIFLRGIFLGKGPKIKKREGMVFDHREGGGHPKPNTYSELLFPLNFLCTLLERGWKSTQDIQAEQFNSFTRPRMS